MAGACRDRALGAWAATTPATASLTSGVGRGSRSSSRIKTFRATAFERPRVAKSVPVKATQAAATHEVQGRHRRLHRVIPQRLGLRPCGSSSTPACWCTLSRVLTSTGTKPLNGSSEMMWESASPTGFAWNVESTRSATATRRCSKSTTASSLQLMRNVCRCRRRFFDRAAEFRARYGLRTPDAIHAAAAICNHCDALLTNDRRRFDRVPGLVVELLQEPSTA